MREYWYLLLVCATFGFAVNYVCLGVVKHAGSLMVKTMSQLKNVVVIAAAVVIYGDDVSKLEMIGYAIAVVGFLAFNRAKALDNAVVRDILASSEKDASYPESESESLLGRHPLSYRGSESA
jgi:drug/metabolite transporter (DMT)-like permease